MAPAIAEQETIEIKPQEGPQKAFLGCSADIVVYGGAVFGGKTFGILLDILHFIARIKGFGAVVFRRKLTQVTNEGGLWDEAKKLYKPLGGDPIANPYRITFPPHGNKTEFHHLNQEDDVDGWDGSQIPGLYFDELQHFESSQFWYMLSRNRTDCGVKAYCRATCNPPKVPGHWLRELVDWWIDSDGWPIPERSGVIRYLLRRDNVTYWADTPEELIEKFDTPEKPAIPKSFTFIAATMADNKIGTSRDPGYAGNVEAQIESERLRMKGNWNARSKPGELMRREDFDIIEPDEVPFITEWVRYWDRAGTEPNEDNQNPDWTAGARLGLDKDGIIYISHVDRFRKEPSVVYKRILLKTKIEREFTTAVLEGDPGQAGKAEIGYYRDSKDFLGLPLDSVTKTSKMSKISVWRPFALQVRSGRCRLVHGDWNEAFIAEAESVIDGTQDNIKDDQIDAAAGAFMYLAGDKNTGSQGGGDLDVM